MSRVAAAASILIGLLFLGLAALIVGNVPSSVVHYGQEPEELLGLAIALPICAFLGAAASFAGVVLVRKRGFRWITPIRATGFLIVSAVLLFLFSLIGFIFDDPTLKPAQFLLLPAIVLTWSSHIMWKEFRVHKSSPIERSYAD